MLGEGQTATSPEQGTGWNKLRVEREAQGLSLEQVSAYLKLTARQIEAIERGDLTALPGAAFARGFVRNYARFLKLDPAQFVALIDSAEGQHIANGLPTEMYSANLGRMPSSGDSRLTALPILAIVVVLICLVFAGWHYHWFESREEAELLASSEQSEPELVHSAPAAASQPVAVSAPVAASAVAEASAPSGAQSDNLATQSVPSVGQSQVIAAASQPVVRVQQSGVPAARQSAPVAVQSGVARSAAQSAPIKVATQSAVPVTGQSLAPGMSRIVLAFDGNSWVEVRDASGKSVFSRMNQAGSVQEVQGAAPFTLVIGNAPQVKLTWKGRAMDLTPYIKGDVARVTLQ